MSKLHRNPWSHPTCDWSCGNVMGYLPWWILARDEVGLLRVRECNASGRHQHVYPIPFYILQQAQKSISALNYVILLSRQLTDWQSLCWPRNSTPRLKIPLLAKDCWQRNSTHSSTVSLLTKEFNSQVDSSSADQGIQLTDWQFLFWPRNSTRSLTVPLPAKEFLAIQPIGITRIH